MPGLSQLISATTTTLEEILQDYHDKIDIVFRQPGSIDALNQAAQTWSDTVENMVSNVAGTLQPGQLQAQDDWKGIAAAAYKTTIPAQINALGVVKTTANQISTSLTTVANALNSFYTALKVTLAAFLGALVTAIAACCTVVTAPEGLVVLATFAGGCLVAIGEEMSALATLANAANTTNMTIAQALNDNTNLRNGKWPVSKSDLSDAHGGWQVA
jgi:hypothetical protein